MCNLSEGVRDLGREEGRAEGREEGRVEGRAEGRAEGREEGRAEGRAEGFLVSIRSLMANTGWPMEKAMELLNVPETDRNKYAGLLQNQ